ncbi:hypothetical protein LPY66_13320 [Dehalobacter sp. DCM]|uniref:hypothetical protein n=1 Tax=Dehalobacter sp. DCM TaxID=2907827 RepID=UPI003081E234|nr:hypothetical protein LPY66_13320 [Dehalobacter sp. DCM]
MADIFYDKGKVIPPVKIMQESLDYSLQNKLEKMITAEILEQNHYTERVAEALRQVKQNCPDCDTHLEESVQRNLKRSR